MWLFECDSECDFDRLGDGHNNSENFQLQGDGGISEGMGITNVRLLSMPPTTHVAFPVMFGACVQYMSHTVPVLFVCVVQLPTEANGGKFCKDGVSGWHVHVDFEWLSEKLSLLDFVWDFELGHVVSGVNPHTGGSGARLKTFWHVALNVWMRSGHNIVHTSPQGICGPSVGMLQQPIRSSRGHV